MVSQPLFSTNSQSITRALIDKYISFRLNQKTGVNGSNISKSTVNLELRHLKAIFNIATDWELINKNPFTKIKMLRVLQSELPKYFQVEEIERIREVFKGNPLEDIVNFYLWTGTRRNEALSLSWDDVNFKKKEITIRARNSKSKRYRILYPPEECWTMLSSLKKRKDNLVFGPRPVRGEERPQWNPDYIGRKISQVLDRLGMEWATCHTFRHTFASHLVMAGVPLYTVKELLGHSTIKTTEIYSHLAPRHKSEMQSKLPY